MTETTTVLRRHYDPSLPPCSHCGAWRWQETLDQWCRDVFACGECGRESDARSVLVGQD